MVPSLKFAYSLMTMLMPKIYIPLLTLVIAIGTWLHSPFENIEHMSNSLDPFTTYLITRTRQPLVAVYTNVLYLIS